MQTTYQASLAAEKYIAIAPAQSVNSGNPPGSAPFMPRDIFVTYGDLIFRATPPGPNNFAFFAQITCSETDHTGITFDKVGTFGNDMIVTCKDGGVFRIDGIGAVTQIATGVGAEAEGPVVAPVAFGTFGGQILVADEGGGAINSVENTNPPNNGPYIVHHNIFNWPSNFQPTPEHLSFVPETLCTFCGFAYFQSSQQNSAGFPSMFAYPPTDFTGLANSLIVALESDQRIVRVEFQAGNYATTVFDFPPGFNILEGASFVDCDIPTPTPTSTPTATFTPTSTATATATFTPTA